MVREVLENEPVKRGHWLLQVVSVDDVSEDRVTASPVPKHFPLTV